MVPPLVLDIDGTLTRGDTDQKPEPIDPRICSRLLTWEAPIVIATGKAFPFPIALCQFLGLDRRVIAENGGIACVGNHLEILGDGASARAVVSEMAERGYDPSPDRLQLINRWRETEVAFRREVPLELLEDIAAEYDLHVVDTGYAYHVKEKAVSKGRALSAIAAYLDDPIATFVAIGDSINDVSLFELVGEGVAVANADHAARKAADLVTKGSHADGVLETLDRLEISSES